MTQTRRLTHSAFAAGFAAAAALASAAPAAADDTTAGRIYGTIETESGNRYVGLLRWSDEEAFWDDLFNASKREREGVDRLSSRDRRKRRDVEIFGMKIAGSWSESWEVDRQFIARFGDIAEIRPRSDSRGEVVMKGGSRHEIGGGSNDVGAEITVWDGSLGKVEVDWDRIRSIQFAAAPASVVAPERRLYAKIKTLSGDFEGFVQWDSEECLSTDKLDGEAEDGDMSIEMGKIRAIERRSRRGAWVELVDGRRLLLEDTNDVDESIRGILVEDERYGRVEIPWDIFVRADFEATAKSGRAYATYGPAKKITATVHLREGGKKSGEIAYDLDETESWELLNGSQDDVEYSVPFARVKSVEPTGSRSSRVTLDNGKQLKLEGQTDVTDGNDGIAFLGQKDDADYTRWEDIERIDFP